ncbi:hypothetical protein [Amycolatopsis alkalitolerans]|uniref:Uncharacterized protein n=1 Tax=Amycolatopsis alkalitolerans TaxID=2547244 RepID=A0A5C4LTX1_9PSEU|nr:hypothetical protein [Amycolatopsis alkalitolerans]TNC21078.1 hypothetical protein FG385_29265 [Amycolatopsis alkalitolerans]
MVQQILDGAGFFSESEIVLKILTLCGLDVEDWVKERFFGNFEAVAKSRNALKNLANFDTASATNTAEGAQTMFSSWQGNAAEAAAALAAAGCLQEIPGVDVLIDIIGAWRVTKIILKIHDVANIWNAVWSGSEGMMGLITVLVGGLSSFDASAKLPKIGYANAAQGDKPNSSPAPQQTGGLR